jgi:3-methyl-2-oxobutanoate hydroxymethyltransferase
VLVFHDVVGLNTGPAPRFVRRYADVAGVISDAARRFIEDVRAGAFPAEAETYSVPSPAVAE